MRNLIMVFSSLFLLNGCTLTNVPPPKEDITLIAKEESDIAKQAVGYEIIKTEDQSHKAVGQKLLTEYTLEEIDKLPTNKKMLYRVVLSSEIKEHQAESTINKIIEDLTTKDRDIDEITLFLYSDKKLIDGTYDLGTATWAPKGELGNVDTDIAKSNNRKDYKITIKIREELENYLKQRGKSEEKFGLMEDQRRQFYKEIVAAEDRAIAEAEQIYPIDYSSPNYKDENLVENFEKNSEKYEALANKYRELVYKKYGVSREEAREISKEAFQENWALE